MWMAAFHAPSIGLDIYLARVPTANEMSGHMVFDTHNSWPTDS